MNGAPAKPISGVPPSSATSPRTASVMKGTCSGLRSGIASTSASVRTGRSTTGPTPGHDVEVDADGLERQHDVGEEDGRVHAVATHRLQRDLDDQVGLHAGLEHPDALAQTQVLGQRPTGLSHVPDRCVRRRFAPGGPEERRVVQRVARLCSGPPGMRRSSQVRRRVQWSGQASRPTLRAWRHLSTRASSHPRLRRSSVVPCASCGPRRTAPSCSWRRCRPPSGSPRSPRRCRPT